jgi:hypothetical protein
MSRRDVDLCRFLVLRGDPGHAHAMSYPASTGCFEPRDLFDDIAKDDRS